MTGSDGGARLFLVIVHDDNGEFNWGIHPSKEQCVDWAVQTYGVREDSDGVAVGDLSHEDRWAAFQDDFDGHIEQIDADYLRGLLSR